MLGIKRDLELKMMAKIILEKLNLFSLWFDRIIQKKL